MIYLDNAATSYPKPPTVAEAMKKSLFFYGANPGRSGHSLAVKTAQEVYETRKILNDFFQGYGEEFVSFTSNCTQALNTAIKGFLKKGDHVVVSSMEHNSVVRPVHTLKEKGFITYSVFKVTENPDETLENFKNAFEPHTRLCVVTAVSNVFGFVLPLEKMAEYSHKKGAFFFVDGAQGAGVIPLKMKDSGIDCLCIPGHKGLLGPMGTGAILHKNLDILPLLEGGTGSASFNLKQPSGYPERLESGTLNVPGICGLKEGVKVVKNLGVDNIRRKEMVICREVFEGLKTIKGVKLYTDNFNEKSMAPVISFNINNLHSEQVASMLDRGGVAVRGGFHCSPFAHISMNTNDRGTVRISPSFKTTKKDINILLNLVRKIAIKEFI